MRNMSGLDGAFLHIETPDTPMHVAALYLLARPEACNGDFFSTVKRLLMPRLSLSPFFRARLAPMPLQFANPVWVDSAALDIDYHLRHIALPKPGNRTQLEDRVAELHATLLDRHYPLWEMYVIEGLESGDIALYLKIHHAALDGAAGIALSTALFDLTAETLEAPADSHKQVGSSEQPGLAQRVDAAFRHTAAQYVKLGRHLPEVMRVLAGMIKTTEYNTATKPQRGAVFAPKTPLNVPITGERGFAAISLPLDEIRHIARYHEVKINDVVLAICSGALRLYLHNHGGVPRRSLIATMPVSLREAGNTDTTTQATLTRVKLATHIADPLRRLRAISAATDVVKAQTNRAKSIIPTDFPSIGVPWVLSTLASLYGRSTLAKIIPPLANLAISNIPGPQQPLYVAGARIRAYWPLSIVEHGLGLNITVLSYCESLDIGLTVARNAVPEVRLLAQALTIAHEELKQLSATPAASNKSGRKGAASVRSKPGRSA
jgi:diacylglycerol O-acyltransferase